MDAQELLRRLQIVLATQIRTGQITLNLKDGRLESFETKTHVRLRERSLVPEISLDNASAIGAH